MTVLNLELFNALIDAGADKELAEKAASTPASIDARLARLEVKINLLYGLIIISQLAVYLKIPA